MAASKSPAGARTLDGKPEDPTGPFAPMRSTFQSDMDRVQSGGLDDDPTDSGEPVRNRRSFRNLKGGR
jgi:hypothetical protein